jgi:hypothetical protein
MMTYLLPAAPNSVGAELRRKSPYAAGPADAIEVAE